MLCGTREDVAAGALRFHDEADLELPLLQPVVQEDDQMEAILDAASALAGYRAVRRRRTVPARPRRGLRRPAERRRPCGTVATTALADDRALGLGRAPGARVGTAWEIVRPFAFTATIMPIAAGGALAATDGRFSWPPFLLALVGGVLLHSGTNIINEVFDVRKGIDTITSPRASHAVLKGRLTERGACGWPMPRSSRSPCYRRRPDVVRGWPIVALGLIGLAGGYFYTAPPFPFKYHALGVPSCSYVRAAHARGGYFAVSGTWA